MLTPCFHPVLQAVGILLCWNAASSSSFQTLRPTEGRVWFQAVTNADKFIAASFFLCNFIILHQQRATFSPHLCFQLPLVVSWVPARTFDLFIELRVRGSSQREVVCFCLFSLWSGLTKLQLDTFSLIWLRVDGDSRDRRLWKQISVLGRVVGGVAAAVERSKG